MAGKVSVPEANLVPLQAPLAVQLDATGVVDQVRTGVRLPVAEVLLAVNVMLHAVCAWAIEANNSIGSAKIAYETLCMIHPLAWKGAEAASSRRWGNHRDLRPRAGSAL